MNYDKYGQAYTTESELCDILYKNPNQDLSLFRIDTNGVSSYAVANKKYYDIFEKIDLYVPIDAKEEVPVELFDWAQQQNWYMPNEYKTLDIAQWILDQCKTDAELQRVGNELLLYQERNLFNLLKNNNSPLKKTEFWNISISLYSM